MPPLPSHAGDGFGSWGLQERFSRGAWCDRDCWSHGDTARGHPAGDTPHGTRHVWVSHLEHPVWGTLHGAPRVGYGTTGHPAWGTPHGAQHGAHLAQDGAHGAPYTGHSTWGTSHGVCHMGHLTWDVGHGAPEMRHATWVPYMRHAT